MGYFAHTLFIFMQIKKLLGLLLMGSSIAATAQETKSVNKRLPAYRTEEEKALSIIRNKQTSLQLSIYD